MNSEVQNFRNALLVRIGMIESAGVYLLTEEYNLRFCISKTLHSLRHDEGEII